MKSLIFLVLTVPFMVLLLSVPSVGQTPVGTAFSYQGRLKDGEQPADGTYDIGFLLYDQEFGGSQIGETYIANDLEITDGLLNIGLDFGAEAFSDEARWLQIAIRPGDDTGSFSFLSPRVRLMPAPQSIYASTAGSVLWEDISNVPGGFADGVDNQDDTVDFSEIQGIVGNAAEQVAEGNHLHDGRYFRKNQLNTSGAAEVHWDNLVDVPGGFADGVDQTDDTVEYSEIEALVGEGAGQVAAATHEHDGLYYEKGKPVDSALRLEPGATVVGEPQVFGGSLFSATVEGFHVGASAIRARISTGSAIVGNSTGGYGVYGYSPEGNAIVGISSEKTAGVFESDDGYGIHVTTNSNRHWSHAGYFTANYGYGIYATSQENNAIRGESGDTTGAWRPSGNVGVTGISENRGVYGSGVDGAGTTGMSLEASGVYGNSDNSYGVEGRSTDSYGGYFYSSNYRGLYASSAEDWYAGYFVNRGGSGSAGVYINGNLVVTGSKSGYVVDIALNDDDEPLQTGDVVVVTGHDAPVLGAIPLLKVKRCDSEASRAVVGVVDSLYVTETVEGETQKTILKPAPSELRSKGDAGILPGQYLSIVTLGSFKTVKVDASYGSIQPGDLLVSSPNPGFAMRSDSPQIGTVIGKSLGSLESGVGEVPVLITLQ